MYYLLQKVAVTVSGKIDVTYTLFQNGDNFIILL